MQDAGNSKFAERGFYALIAHISESCQDGEHPAKVVPFSTFVGGFPFASSGFNDGEGYYFAKDTSGGLVIVDTWKRGGDRTNSNFCVMGNSGVGKSTAIKHILLSEYMKGTRIIVIDPESEYRDLCQNLNGDWINAVGGSKGMINPLQVRPSPRDDEDEIEELRLYRDEGYGMNDLALHMKNLEIFFSLYIPSLTDMQKAVLKNVWWSCTRSFTSHGTRMLPS